MREAKEEEEEEEEEAAAAIYSSTSPSFERPIKDVMRQVMAMKPENGREEEREAEGKTDESEISGAIKELSTVKAAGEKKDSTIAFLAASNILLRVLDKIGPTMAVLRQDIQRNIERIEELYLSNPANYSSLMEVLKKEADEGIARKTDSCSRAVLWLTRSMKFGVELLERSVKDSEASLAQVVEEAYQVTLKPWHGWISSAAYKVAMKLIPERKDLMELLVGKLQDCEKLQVDVGSLVSLLDPLLDEVQDLLSNFRLDRLKST